MPLIKNGAIAEDIWLSLADDEPLPGYGAIIVSLARWQRDAELLRARRAPLGIMLASGERADELLADLPAFELIALDFPTFRDGRPYSTARLLRERYGFIDELRAVGDVARDQFLFMHRCGFDSFQVDGDGALENWLRAVSEITIWYQPTGEAQGMLSTQRHQQAAAE